MHTVLIFSAEVMKLGSGGLVVGGRKERRLRGKGLSEKKFEKTVRSNMESSSSLQGGALKIETVCAPWH
jgi:hypothetical protein